MDQLLTVREAKELCGKSESTIKRLIREIVKSPDHSDRSSIQPSNEELTLKKKAGEPYIWKIDRQFILQRFPVDPETRESKKSGGVSGVEVSAPLVEVLREQLQSKDRQIETLEKQLDRKDEQIGNQNERMRETNILMRELQERLVIAAPAPTTESADIVVIHDPKEGSEGVKKTRSKPKPRTQSIWQREFHLFGRKSS